MGAAFRSVGEPPAGNQQHDRTDKMRHPRKGPGHQPLQEGVDLSAYMFNIRRHPLLLFELSWCQKKQRPASIGRARFLNRDKRVGPSAKVIKRILSSPNVPPAVRRKVEEYIANRIGGLYGHFRIGDTGAA